MKKRNGKYTLPMPGNTTLRSMQSGDTRVFSAGKRTPSGPFSGATLASMGIFRIKAEMSQRMMLLVDPITHETVPVIVVHCHKAGNPPKKRGRKAAK